MSHELFNSKDISQLKQGTSLLMVSGGPDSVFLFHEFLKLKNKHEVKDPAASSGVSNKIQNNFVPQVAEYKTPSGGVKFAVVHFNHHLRGAQSTADAGFVTALCREHGVRCHLVHFKFGSKSGLQEAARKRRYQASFDLVRRYGYRFLFTAHHRDDHLETLVMNLKRGAGVSGKSGIKKKQLCVLGEKKTCVLWRPMLTWPKTQILRSLTRRRLEFCVDSSNKKPVYLRNRVRQDVVAKMTESKKKRLIQDALRFQTLDERYRKQVDKLLGRYPLHVPLPVWRSWPEEICFRFFAAKLAQYGFKQQVERKHFVLFEEKKINKMTFGEALALRDEKGYYFVKAGDLSGVWCPVSNVKELRVDADKLKFPLRFVAPVLNQKFIPYGRTHIVPLKKLFQSRRFGVYERLFCPVLVDAMDRIVAVMGVEIADEFKVTAATQKILQIGA